MSDDSVNKEVFQHNMKTIHKSLDRMNDALVKLFEKQEEMNTILTRNTVVVKEHHARSNRFEGIVEELSSQFINLGKEFVELRAKVEDIDDDLQPIKVHVTGVNKLVGFLEGIPATFKFILLILTIASSAIGLFTVGKELIVKPAAVIKQMK